MSGFSLLWGSLLKSSLWIQESKETKLLWVAMLAMKDQNGVIKSSLVGLADSAKLTVDECRRSLVVLLSPDPNDSSKVEEGRRVREIPGGWEIINHGLYQFSTEARRENWRLQKEAQRKREKEQIERRLKLVRGGGSQQEKLEIRAEADRIEREAEEVYEAYPRKVGKPAAMKAIAKQLRLHPFDLVMTATQGFAKAWAGEADKSFCPHPSTWFNQERFKDDPSTWRNSGNGHAPKPESIYEIQKVIECKQKLADQLKMRHAHEDGLGVQWQDEEARVEYVRLKGEIKELNAQIAGRA